MVSATALKAPIRGHFLAVPRCKSTTGPACPVASKTSPRKSTAATPPAWRSPPARAYPLTSKISPRKSTPRGLKKGQPLTRDPALFVGEQIEGDRRLVRGQQNFRLGAVGS